MSTNEIRALSIEETDMVAGGALNCVYWDGKTLTPTVCSATEAYIDAFLKGVEQGKNKGKPKQ
jgi:hypothetical protein